MWEVWEDGQEIFPPHTPHTPSSPIPHAPFPFNLFKEMMNSVILRFYPRDKFFYADKY